MKRPVLLVIAAGLIAALAFALPNLTRAEPGSLSRSDVTVRLAEATTGTVAVEVEVPAEVAAVSLFATMPHMGHTTAEITATRVRPGLFRADGELFSMPGSWELHVRADARLVTFEITVK